MAVWRSRDALKSELRRSVRRFGCTPKRRRLPLPRPTSQPSLVVFRDTSRINSCETQMDPPIAVAFLHGIGRNLSNSAGADTPPPASSARLSSIMHPLLDLPFPHFILDQTKSFNHHQAGAFLLIESISRQLITSSLGSDRFVLPQATDRGDVNPESCWTIHKVSHIKNCLFEKLCFRCSQQWPTLSCVWKKLFCLSSLRHLCLISVIGNMT